MKDQANKKSLPEPAALLSGCTIDHMMLLTVVFESHPKPNHGQIERLFFNLFD